MLTLDRVELTVAVPAPGSFTVMSQDGGIRSRSSSVMKEDGASSKPPKGCCLHLVRTCRGLTDAVGQAAHVVQQEVRVEVHRLKP